MAMVKREAVEGESGQGAAERRVIRSQYLALKNLISDRKDDIARADSENFSSIISEVESLHQFVRKPREQVADAEALLDMASTLLASCRSQRSGATPSDFVSALISNFGLNGGLESMHNGSNIVSWADIGFFVSHAFKNGTGCGTMVGPMNNEIKQRTYVVRKRTRPNLTERASPKELAGNEEEEMSDTAKNMLIMFEILRRKRTVRLEALVFNRVSFAQTIENIFALSFLVKDGRAEINLNEAGNHLVSPRNAPAASAISSGEVRYNHFVFRFDYNDWTIMHEAVGVGEELMPHRSSENTATTGYSQAASRILGPSTAPISPVKKLSRNRGFLMQDHLFGNCSLEEDDACGNESDSLPMKRRLIFDQ